MKTFGLRELGLLTVIALLPSCYASNVVAAEDREVIADFGSLEWGAVEANDLPGLYESVEIEGEAAASIWKIHYYFDEDGAYTAAALVNGPEGPLFQALTGTWQLGPEGLVLDDAEAVPCTKAGEHLRIAAPTGAVTLLRSELR